MLGVCALLAIPFKSYIQPLIIMVSIPFGVVALSGVVVNDFVVLIDFANEDLRLKRNSGELLPAGARRSTDVTK
ncbi:MAG: efflux RND transporter permease subunit [Deltaproteobacteria bacterium]|nr:efflux RND transporter permease subunit [Deltaproteobacteria bacterium]